MPQAYPLITHYHDVVVIGAGGAGLMASLCTSQHGLDIACISKVFPTRSHTVAAQGGINAALGNVIKDDWRWHMYDTIRGGDWLGDQDAIAYMCKHASGAITQLEKLGVPFTRDANGKIYQRVYGGQATEYGKGELAYRACSAADRTGHAILHTLYQQSLANRTRFFVEYMALDLLMDEENVCRGVLAWHVEEGTLHLFRSHQVIIATGGYSQVYKTSSSSSICTGDGNAMALRAGLALQDMEFIQFHPTGLHGTGFLITEAARAEGGYIVNNEGERFMERYAPKYRDLASRDVIARAMSTEIIQKRGCGEEANHLYLCLQHLDEETIRKKLPTVFETAHTFARINPCKDPIPVVPTAHYTMGGIPTNMYGEVLGEKHIIEGLMAIGEAACVSVHGANRLGCNSLLDLIVFGQAAGEKAAKTIKKNAPHKTLNPSIVDKALSRFDSIRHANGKQPPSRLRKSMQNIMEHYVNVFRTEPLLKEGLNQITTLHRYLHTEIAIPDQNLRWNNDLLEAVETANLLDLALATTASALARKESRGAHFREDYPDRNDKKWLHHSRCTLEQNSTIKMAKAPIRIHTEEESIPHFSPENRSY